MKPSAKSTKQTGYVIRNVRTGNYLNKRTYRYTPLSLSTTYIFPSKAEARRFCKIELAASRGRLDLGICEIELSHVTCSYIDEHWV